jgi:hypothetical protein
LLKNMEGVTNLNLGYAAVADMQIIAALNKNLGKRYVTGTLYDVQRVVANEARERGLLINPNPGGPTALGNTTCMLPSLHGWEETKYIQQLCLDQD